MPKLKSVVKEGTVVFANRKYYVAIGRAKKEIPTGAFMDAAALKRLVGQTVSVTIFGQSVVSIGRPGILCYFPVDPSLFTLILPELQNALLKKYTEAGIITAG